MLKRDDPTLKMYDLINFSQFTDPKYSKYQTSARISLDRSLAIVKDIEEEIEDGWTNPEIISYLEDNRSLWDEEPMDDYPEGYDPEIN